MHTMKVLYQLVFLCGCFGVKAGLIPIVLVPGIGGSQIEARLDREKATFFWCKKKSDWYTIWLSIEQLLPFVERCWHDNIGLVYNPITMRMENTRGVYTRVPGFGNTSSVEWLDPDVHGLGVGFFPFVDTLVRLMGYRRGETIKAAPYDFRLDPGTSSEYFVKLKEMIENSYSDYRKPVMLVSHSMGSPFALHFLNQQTQQWKDTHIHGWTSISGVFGGAVKAVMAYVSGYGFGIPSILQRPIALRTMQRSFSSLAFLLPDKNFWAKDEIMVRTGDRSYTIQDYDHLFEDIGYPLASTIRKHVPRAWQNKAPGVRMYCFHGVGKQTPSVLSYDEFPDEFPRIEYGNGDGTVNLRSLEACRLWQSKQKQEINYRTFSGGEHVGVLGDARLVRAFVDVLRNNKI